MAIQQGIKTFKVHISPYHSVLITGGNIESAKQEAWRAIAAEQGYYRYGWIGQMDFMKNVLVTEV